MKQIILFIVIIISSLRVAAQHADTFYCFENKQVAYLRDSAWENQHGVMHQMGTGNWVPCPNFLVVIGYKKNIIKVFLPKDTLTVKISAPWEQFLNLAGDLEVDVEGIGDGRKCLCTFTTYIKPETKHTNTLTVLFKGYYIVYRLTNKLSKI